MRFLPAAGVRLSRGRFPHRAGTADIRRRLAILQSGAERDRVVDFLGPRSGRPEQESADGLVPTAFADARAAHVQAPAGESKPSARNVAPPGEPRIVADPDQDAAGR